MVKIGNEFSKLIALERGGQATIYRGWQESLQRYVAIKASDKTDAKNARAIIDHTRSIATKLLADTPVVYDCFIEAKRVWTVMELYEGLSLDKINSKEWPVDVRLYIVFKVAGIVDSLHSDGLLHGDLKPGNIMITRKGDVKLVDFGMSQHSEAKNQPLMLQGTLSYNAPERALLGEAGKPSIDIFALGIILNEIISGKRPDLDDITSGRPLQWPGTTPESIKTLTNQCVASFPDQRPDARTIGEVIKSELNKFVNNRYETILADYVEPLFCRYMAEKCFNASSELIKRDRLNAYSLLCEALEWDADFVPAIKALEEFPPEKNSKKGNNRFLLLLVIIVGSIVGAVLTGTFMPPSGQPPVVVYNAKNGSTKEFLGEPLVAHQKPQGTAPLMASAGTFKDSSLLILKYVQKDAVVYLDKKIVHFEKSPLVSMHVRPGDHELVAVHAGDTLFYEFFTILPYEEKKIEIAVVRGNM